VSENMSLSVRERAEGFPAVCRSEVANCMWRAEGFPVVRGWAAGSNV
jgi:hypothetical protein